MIHIIHTLYYAENIRKNISKTISQLSKQNSYKFFLLLYLVMIKPVSQPPASPLCMANTTVLPLTTVLLGWPVDRKVTSGEKLVSTKAASGENILESLDGGVCGPVRNLLSISDPLVHALPSF